MSYDTVASLQRIQQLQQSEAAAGKRLILNRVPSILGTIIFLTALFSSILTLGLSLVLYAIYFLIKELTVKTYLVKNVATGEKFRVDRKDFKQYKKDFKSKEKEVRKISDL
ncbi:hypothetical protein [Bacillus pseudomycoides]|uniref:hypothetical protein n=1 Tax=Bacillus pseudomycoides TaxID=64104 RepID=UPI003CEB97BE